MLDERGIEYRYRNYVKEPLTEAELTEVLDALGVEPREVLRRRDKAFRELGLTGDEDAPTLIRHMADHPTLLQRPIGVAKGRAVIGRPVERLLDLLD